MLARPRCGRSLGKFDSPTSDIRSSARDEPAAPLNRQSWDKAVTKVVARERRDRIEENARSLSLHTANARMLAPRATFRVGRNKGRLARRWHATAALWLPPVGHQALRCGSRPTGDDRLAAKRRGNPNGRSARGPDKLAPHITDPGDCPFASSRSTSGGRTDNSAACPGTCP